MRWLCRWHVDLDFKTINLHSVQLKDQKMLNADLPVHRYTYDSILKSFQKYNAFIQIVVYRMPIIYGSRCN